MRMTKFWLYCQISSALHGMRPVEMVMLKQIIAATLKVLPDFISQNISAVSCGGANPEASVLKGYQLIFMESGFAKEWVNSEYSIIDLQNKKVM